jgi:hypothetical protein
MRQFEVVVALDVAARAAELDAAAEIAPINPAIDEALQQEYRDLGRPMTFAEARAVTSRLYRGSLPPRRCFDCNRDWSGTTDIDRMNHLLSVEYEKLREMVSHRAHFEPVLSMDNKAIDLQRQIIRHLEAQRDLVSMGIDPFSMPKSLNLIGGAGGAGQNAEVV